MTILAQKKSLLTVVISIVVLVIVFGSAVYFFALPKSATALCNDRGDGSLLAEADAVFNGEPVAEYLDQYQDLADRAKGIKDFDQQPNCLYPVMFNQYIIRDIPAALASLEQFEKIRAGNEFAEDIYGNFDQSGVASGIRAEDELSKVPNYIGGGSRPGYPTGGIPE